MKLKSLLAVLGTAAVIGGIALAGLPAAKAIAAGDPPDGAGRQVQNSGQGFLSPGLGRSNGGMVSAVAEFLGIDVSDLIAGRQSGKSMVQIAEEKGKGGQELVDYVVGQRSEQIDRLVTDGKITQEQADLHKQLMTTRVETSLNRTDLGPNRPNGQVHCVQGFRGGSAKGMGAGLGCGAGMGSGAKAGFCRFNDNQAQ